MEDYQNWWKRSLKSKLRYSKNKLKKIKPGKKKMGKNEKITPEDIDKLKESLDGEEGFFEKFKSLFDLTGDKKVDWQDLKAFVGLFIQTAFLAYLIVFMVYRDELLNMIVTGNWDPNFIYNNILLAGASAIWAYIRNIFQKRFFSESIARTNAEKEAIKAKEELYEEIHQNKIKSENMAHKHALELKEKEIELMEKDVITLSKDEITRIEIRKNEILEEEKEEGN